MGMRRCEIYNVGSVRVDETLGPSGPSGGWTGLCYLQEGSLRARELFYFVAAKPAVSGPLEGGARRGSGDRVINSLFFLTNNVKFKR